MDVKKLLKGIEPFERLELDNDQPTQDKFIALQHKYQQTASHLKRAQSEKRLIASQFKDAKNDPSILVKLKEDMTDKSKTVSELESQLSAIVERATGLLESSKDQKKPLPEQFTQPTEYLAENFWIECCDVDDDRWKNFVANQHSACAYHQPSIQKIIKKSFGYTSRVLLAISEKDVVGGLPVTAINSKLFGNNTVSVPYFNYGGPLTSYKNVAVTLIDYSKTLIETEDINQIEIRTTTPALHSVVSDKKVSMLLPLPNTESVLDKNLGAKVRAQYNKANEHSPTVKFGGIELLKDFYTVFSINMRDLGTPVYSKAWFYNLLVEDQIDTHIVVCYVNDKPVSAGFLLAFRDLLEIPWASTIRSANHLNINMWMYRQILGFAIQQGYAFFDFGRSTKGASTYNFKKQWGAQPIQHYWYYLNESNKVSESNPDNPKFRILIAIWKRIPVWFANLIGPTIVKQIP